MPLAYHLIDGYNLLHAAGLARATYGPGDLDRARTGLLVRLAEGLRDSERGRTTVVFDAADPPPDAERSFRFRGMGVMFAVDEGEADALIEDLIRRHPSPRQLRVVSDDVRLQKAAKRRGAQAVKSDALLKRLRSTQTPIGPGSRDGGQIDAESAPVSDWLEFFGMGCDRVEVDVSSRPAREPADARRPAGDEAADVSSDRATTGRRRSDQPRRAVEAASKPGPPDDEPPGEDLRFWQQRIDELLGEEKPRPGAG